MINNPDIVFTKHADGTITASHHPAWTWMSVPLAEAMGFPAEPFTVDLAGQEYRSAGKDPRMLRYLLVRSDVGVSVCPHRSI